MMPPFRAEQLRPKGPSEEEKRKAELLAEAEQQVFERAHALLPVTGKKTHRPRSSHKALYQLPDQSGSVTRAWVEGSPERHPVQRVSLIVDEVSLHGNGSNGSESPDPRHMLMVTYGEHGMVSLLEYSVDERLEIAEAALDTLGYIEHQELNEQLRKM